MPEPTKGIVLEASQLVVRFGGVLGLDGFSYDFPYRGVVSLIGSNGAGKSTLLDVLSGFIAPSEGLVREKNTGARMTRRELGSRTARLHQAIVLPENLSIGDFLTIAAEPELGRWISRASSQAVRRECGPAVDLLSTVGLSMSGDELLGELSWGQQRIVALCAMVSAGKEILLLDEPFSGLSAVSLELASSLVTGEAEDRLVVIAEHDLDSVASVADTVLVLRGGRLVRKFQKGEFARDELIKYFG